MKEISTSLPSIQKRPGLYAKQQRITDNLEQLLEVLPPDIRREMEQQPDLDDLTEIVLDLGREPEARFPTRVLYMVERLVTLEDIHYVIERVGEFGKDNRAGIERTLHRISAIRNRQGKIVGLTCRIGRAVYGTIDIIRDVVETGKSILMLGRPGVGKCIAGGSLVFSEKGMLPIRRFVPDGLAPDTFAAYRTTLHGLEGPVASSHVYYGGYQETFRIFTEQGYSLEGTPEHPIVILTGKGDLEFRSLASLRVGDRVALQRGQELFGREISLPPLPPSPAGYRFPRRMTQGLARFLGYVLASGWPATQDVITLWHDEPQTQSDMAFLTESLFGLKLKRYYLHGHWSGQDFYIRSSALRTFLKHLGVQLSPRRRSVPECVLRAPREMVAAFLRGFFEAAAHLRKSRMETVLLSGQLAHQIQVVLLNFGIVSRLKAKRNGRLCDRAYQITVTGRDVELFAAKIGMVSQARAAYLQQMTHPAWNREMEVISHMCSKLPVLRDAVSATATLPVEEVQPVQGERHPDYDTLNAILSLTRNAGNPIRAGLDRLKGSSLFFDKVAIKEAGRAKVYDFSVPISHTFFANGFLNHNTTKLREVARVLSEEFKKRVVIVDTSNEIAGDGDIPHPAIGHARRMQVATPVQQHEVMIEAVENHMPEVIVIDEIGTEAEAYAARTIAERGVQLVATAHGNSLENLLVNPTLSDLIGGIQAVTLSDEEARRRGTQKTVLERKAPPTFDIVIEIMEMDKLAIHHDVATTVDKFLRGAPPRPEIRVHTPEGNIEIVQKPDEEIKSGTASVVRVDPERPTEYQKPLPATVRIFPYGVSRGRLDKAIKELKVPAYIARDWGDADAIITLKAHFRREPAKLKAAMDNDRAVFVVRSNTQVQIESCLREIFQLSDRSIEEMALRETEEGVERAIASQQVVDLMPRNSYIRRLQHQLIDKYKLRSESVGQEPQRRVRIIPF